MSANAVGSWLPRAVAAIAVAAAGSLQAAAARAEESRTPPPASGGLTMSAAEPPSPRRTVEQFRDACRAGDYAGAAALLDTSALPEEQRGRAETLARRLMLVLERTQAIDWARVSDQPGGDPADGPEVDVAGSVRVAEEDIPITLAHTAAAADSGEARWRFSSETVARIPMLYEAHGAGWMGDVLPLVLFRARLFGVEAWQWIGLVVAVPAAYLLGLALAGALLAAGGILARRTTATWDDRLLESSRAPGRLILVMVAFRWIEALLRLPVGLHDVLERTTRTVLFVAVAWATLRMIGFLASVADEILTRGVADEARVRGVRTQVIILRRLAVVVAVVVSAALVLTQFEVVRTIGVSLLATAGIAGIALGLAAQKTISSLLAGIQLSITQPIRIGDTVIVEGEFGWIEEIHFTYVVVKVWDLRRLVVPIGRFLEQPFQNWSKVSPEIMGTVEIYADYAVPVEAVREELERECRSDPLWNGKVCGLQVTNVTEQTVTLRALVSAADAGKCWDLRCRIREKLVAFLRRLEDGAYLPRARVDASHPDGGEHGAEAAVVGAGPSTAR